MLMGMRLRAAAHAHGDLAGGFAAHDKCRPAIRHRAAIQQLERQRHRFRAHHVSDCDRVVELGAGMHRRVAPHQHRDFGEIFLGHAVFVHVSRGDEPVIGWDGRAERHLVFRMSDLRQRLDRGIAALAGQPILAGHHQHISDHVGLDQVMRQHGHRKPRRTANLHGVRISGTDAEMLGEYGSQHDMRRHRAVAAQDAVDITSFQAGIADRLLGGPAHEVE